MTIFEKYPEMSKGRLITMLGRVSKLYDSGNTIEQIVKELGQPIGLISDLIAIKEKAEYNRRHGEPSL